MAERGGTSIDSMEGGAVKPSSGQAARDLEIAHNIQQGLLPRSFPKVPGVDIAAQMTPAREVGGDFYDVIPLSGGRVGLLVADVSDKGVPAALYMALARTLLRAFSLNNRPQYLSDALESAQVRQLMRSGSLGALSALGAVRQTNEYMAEHHSDSDMFVTIFYAVYEPATRMLTYVNAGHNPAILYSAENETVAWLERTDMSVGFMPGRPYEAKQRRLAPGDLLVLYTDGVTEAFNRAGAMFGNDLLEQAVRAHTEVSARRVITGIQRRVRAFGRGVPQSDDQTYLVLRCLPRSRSSDNGGSQSAEVERG